MWTVTENIGPCDCCGDTPCDPDVDHGCGISGWWWYANSGVWVPDGVIICDCGTPAYPSFPGIPPDIDTHTTTFCCANCTGSCTWHWIENNGVFFWQSDGLCGQLPGGSPTCQCDPPLFPGEFLNQEVTTACYATT
jgi:hypothetical protein